MSTFIGIFTAEVSLNYIIIQTMLSFALFQINYYGAVTDKKLRQKIELLLPQL
jgi:hypothetical protein